MSSLDLKGWTRRRRAWKSSKNPGTSSLLSKMEILMRASRGEPLEFFRLGGLKGNLVWTSKTGYLDLTDDSRNPKFLVLCFVFEIEFEFRALRRTLRTRELIREECSKGHATKSEPSKEVTLFTLQFTN